MEGLLLIVLIIIYIVIFESLEAIHHLKNNCVVTYEHPTVRPKKQEEKEK